MRNSHQIQLYSFFYKNKTADLAGKSKTGKDKEKGKKDAANDASAAQVSLANNSFGFKSSIKTKRIFEACKVLETITSTSRCHRAIPTETQTNKQQFYQQNRFDRLL